MSGSARLEALQLEVMASDSGVARLEALQVEVLRDSGSFTRTTRVYGLAGTYLRLGNPKSKLYGLAVPVLRSVANMAPDPPGSTMLVDSTWRIPSAVPPVVPSTGFPIQEHYGWRVKSTGWSGNSNWSVTGMEIAAYPGGPNLLVGGTPSATSTNGGPAANAFDGSNATSWNSNFIADSAIMYICTGKIICGELRLLINGGPQAPQDLELEYTDDGGANWYHFASLVNQTFVPDVWQVFTFTNGLPNLSNKWRNMTFRRFDGSGLQLQIAEVEFAATIGGVDQCNGGTPSGNTYPGSSGQQPPAVFDNTLSSHGNWLNAIRNVIQYDFPSPVSALEMRVTNNITGDLSPGDLHAQLPDGPKSWRTVGQINGITSAWGVSFVRSVPIIGR